MKRHRYSISNERYQIVITDISEGSEPEMRFYLMVAVSTMIASFGLITNSTAVIIGAMLVAPLMTPIFGLALALIRSDVDLFGKALKAEVVGVAAAVLMGVIIGLLYPALEATPEMIARTEPQLFDLLVAVFSGFAGAYALMDEKISPALPGVAIATAIVPPLANTGLCFSAGQYLAGVGSFLLFFANFLSILLVASATFWFFGMTGSFRELSKKVVVRRFSFPVICFVLVASFLTYTLYNIAHHHFLNEAIETTLETELLSYPEMSLEKVMYDEQEDNLYVFAEMNASTIITPTQVSRLEARLQDQVERSTKLVVNSRVARKVSSLDTNIQFVKRRLDGSFVDKNVHPRVRDVKLADTIIRNYLAELVGYNLLHVRLFHVGESPTLIAVIYGIVTPPPTDIEKLENLLQKEMDNPEIRLMVSFVEAKLLDRTGSVRPEFSGVVPLEAGEREAVAEIVKLVKKELDNIEGLIISGVNHNVIDNKVHVLVDTNGPSTVDPRIVAKIEHDVGRRMDRVVHLYIYNNNEHVVSTEGFESYPVFAKRIQSENLPELRQEISKIIEASNL